MICYAPFQQNENKVFIWIESIKQTFCRDYCRLLVLILWVEKASSHFSHLILQQTIFFEFIFSSACFHWLNKNICFCYIPYTQHTHTYICTSGRRSFKSANDFIFKFVQHWNSFGAISPKLVVCFALCYVYIYMCAVYTLYCRRQMAGHFLCGAVTSSRQILALIFYDKM